MVEVSRRALLQGAGLIALGAGVAACGSSGSAKTSLPPNATLEEKARAEGSIMYYSIGPDTVQFFGDPFKKAYPWATLRSYQADGSTLANKLVTETRAGVKNCDVIECPPGQRSNYLQVKALTTTPGLPNISKVPKSAIDPQNYSIPTYQNPVVIVYNTKLVTSTLPMDIFEYSAPAYKGMLTMERPQALGLAASFLASQRAVWGDDKWMQWLEALSKNDVLITPDSTAAYQAVVSGERAIAVDGVNDVISQDAKVPVKASFYERIAPLPVYLSRTALSPHPDVGALFINSTISVDGQKAIAATGRIPIREDIDAPTAIQNVLPNGSDSLVPIADMKTLYDDPQSYIDIFNKLWPG